MSQNQCSNDIFYIAQIWKVCFEFILCEELWFFLAKKEKVIY